jgi:RNase H-like domain found in reverse transcriptase/Integrase zinc binding domain
MGNDVLWPLYAKYPGKFQHYMDDCIIMTGIGEQELHIQICHDFFELLEQHNLFLKLEKCEFFQMAIDYLGIRVEGGELMNDPAKITGIKEWLTTLKTIKEVRSTLGLLGYHQPWIPNFTQITKPLTDLLQKGKEFTWDATCETAVKRLIRLVMSEPVLVLPDPDQQFILYVDASQFATGAILYQADKERTNKRGDPLLRPIGFHSQTFTKTEQNYPIYDWELLAVIRGLWTWRHLLRNTTTPVLVITNHANLQYYREPHKLSPQVNGYIAELADFNIQLIYRPRATNRADALSRRPDLTPDTDDYPLLIALPNRLFVPPDTPTRSYATTRQKDTPKDRDSDYESDEMELVDHSIPILKARAMTLLDGSELSAKYLDDKIMNDQDVQKATIQRWQLSLSLSKNGWLWTTNGALVVVGNNDVKRGVISLFHDTSTAGHPRITKTLLMMAKYYWWPGMKEFTTNYVKGCAMCQMTKVKTHPNKPTLFPITAEPNALPFQTIAVNFIVKLPTSDGYDSVTGSRDG